MIPPRLASLIRPLASLYLTVLLLSLGLVLVFLGTLAQMHESVWTVERQYFHSFFVLAELYLGREQPVVRLPLPGGWIVGGLLLVNLVAAFLTRFELSRKRVGIILLHLGILVLLVGELLRGVMAVEMQMRIDEGQSRNWTYQLHEPELAVIDPLSEQDNEIAIDGRLLTAGRRISDQKLPFDIEILQWHRHAVVEPAPGGGRIHPLDPSVRSADLNAAALRIHGPDGRVQRVSVGVQSTDTGEPVRARVDLVDAEGRERPWFVELRFRRHYQPFTFHLYEFTHERYEGSDVPRRFSSLLQLTDPERGEDRQVYITMNHPLRYRGLTFYQAGFDGDHTTILQVVDNPAWLGPYFGCLLVALGMLYHFILKLLEFQRRRRARGVGATFTAEPAATRAVAAGGAGGATPAGAAVQPLGGLEGAASRPMGRALVPMVAMLVGLAVLGMSWQRGGLATEPFNFEALASLPVRHDGRTKPLDSAARATLHKLSDRGTVMHEGERLGPTEWYLRTAAEYHPPPPRLGPHTLRPALRAFFADLERPPGPEALFNPGHGIEEADAATLAAALLDPRLEAPLPEHMARQLWDDLIPDNLIGLLIAWHERGPSVHDRILQIDAQALAPIIPDIEGDESRISLARVRPHLPRLYLAVLEVLNKPADDRDDADLAVLELHEQVVRFRLLRNRDRLRQMFAGHDTHRIIGHMVRPQVTDPQVAHLVQRVLTSADDSIPLQTLLTVVREMRLDPHLELMLAAYADRGWGSQVAVFRIDNPQVRGLMGLKDDRRNRFSLRELQPQLGALYLQADRIRRSVSEEHRRPHERDLNELFNKVVFHYGKVLLRRDLKEVVPLDAEQAWRQLNEAPADHPSVRAWRAVFEAWRGGDAAAFNDALETYSALLADPDLAEARQRAEMGRIDVEMLFNRLQPFFWAAALYALVMILGSLSWLGFSEPLRRTAVWLALLVILYHTAALALRVYIHGKPPVTNLHASAIFVGWGSVVLALVLERYYRNALGVVCAGALGFASLVLAQAISAGDDFEAVRAVLNTPFWLTTHVLTVTIGYSAMFVAAALGVVYILGGLLTTALNRERAATVTRMIYGTLCFGLLFSFVGTLLGGLWADQSWGRFWGWDPKENGALMIVIIVAIALHARFCGLIQQRGLAALSLLGGVITAWAWFGVNLLGIGLHSYGFMEGGFEVLLAYVGSQVALMALAAIPARYWKSPGIAGR